MNNCDFFAFQIDWSRARHAFCGGTHIEELNLLRAAKRGEFHPKTPIRIEWREGRRLFDVLWAGLIPLVQRRVVDLLLSNDITGWTGYPVAVFDKAGPSVNGYYGLAISGRCGSIYLDKEHSEIVYEEMPHGRFPMLKGLAITQESWDGSDFFTSADGKSDFNLVTRKVRDLFKREKVPNVTLTPICDITLTISPQALE
jgi:hypothetical protein